MIIASGIYIMFSDGVNIFSEKAMEGTRTEPGYVALAFYSGLFSYSGWWVHVVSFTPPRLFNNFVIVHTYM